MAGDKMFAEVVIAGSYKNLSKATRGAQGEMNSLASKTKKTSAMMKSALAGIGFAVVGRELLDMAKAASEDDQGMRLLAQTMKNNVKGHQELQAGVEDTITKMSIMAAVTDDEIRPAFGYLIRATKSVGKSTKLMQVALDLSAGAHISVEAAASALGRAYKGNLTALNKLAPGIKKLKDPIGEVEKRFKGLAKIQGDNDPFKQMNILADEAKETIGRGLLPYIKKLATWMTSKEGQKQIKKTTDELVKLAAAAGKLGKWVLENKDSIIALGIALKGWQITSGVINSWKTLADIWAGMKSPKTPGVGAAPGGAGGVGGGVMQYKKPIGPKLPGIPGLSSVMAAPAAAAVAVYGTTMTELYRSDKAKFKQEVTRQISNAKKDYGQIYSSTELLTATGVQKGGIGSGGANMAPITMNVTVNGAVSGNEVVNALTRYARGKGIPMSKLLR